MGPLYVREAVRSARSVWTPERRDSAVGVARTAAVADPGGPSSSSGQVGPSTSIRVTVPWPSSSLSRRTTVGASSLSWVAHAVESVRTTSLPSANDVGWQCWATSAPTISASDRRPVHLQVEVPAVVGDQPAEGGVEQLGVALVGVRAGRLRHRRRRSAAGPHFRLARVLAGPLLPGDRSSRPAIPGQRAGQVETAVVVPAGGAYFRRPGSFGGLLVRSARQDSRETTPSPTAYRTPASASARRRHRGGDQHLLGAGDQVGQLLAPSLGVELGEHVVEDQDRVVAVGAQQVVRRQPSASANDQDSPCEA
jgi:hypothetical protein